MYFPFVIYDVSLPTDTSLGESSFCKDSTFRNINYTVIYHL